MEQRHESRARELEAIAATTRQQSEVQRLRDARAHAVELGAKDAQVRAKARGRASDGRWTMDDGRRGPFMNDAPVPAARARLWLAD